LCCRGAEEFRAFAKALGRVRQETAAEYVESARLRSREALGVWVAHLVRKNFSSLAGFFEEVEELLGRIPAEEVPFQNSYSRSALNKLLGRYGPKDVEKKVSHMKKKIARQVSIEEYRPLVLKAAQVRHRTETENQHTPSHTSTHV
jgi:hypothetical protein